jgi:hypothetical protein
MDATALHEPQSWCGLTFPEHRALLAEALREALREVACVSEIVIEAGTIGREYDFAAAVRTDVGTLRTPLWSHARAMIYCDGSIHPANRAQFSPAGAVREAADRLLRRLEVPYALESRGLTVTLAPEDGVERVWTAERSMFRNRTAVTREDRVLNPGEVDIRDLLAHFYTGPSLRLVSESGEAMLLPEAGEAEGAVVSLCHRCGRFQEGSVESCSECGGVADVVVAARPSRR